jgi:hypothetical protein
MLFYRFISSRTSPFNINDKAWLTKHSITPRFLTLRRSLVAKTVEEKGF